MALGTTSTTAKLLKQYWHNFFLENLYDSLTFTDIAKRTKVPKGQGKVVWWYGLNKVNPVGASLSEGADPTSRSSAARRVSGIMAEYGNLITNSKLFGDTSIDGTKAAIMKDLARDAAQTLDNVVRDKVLAGGVALYPGTVKSRSALAAANTATIKEIRKAVRLLQLSSVPKFGAETYIGLAHPDVVYDLQSDSAWNNFVIYRDTVKWDIAGEVGQLWGVRFKLAPTIPTVASHTSASAVDVYRTMIIGEEFVGLSELGDLEIIINEPAKTSELGMKNAYGYYFTAACEVLSNQKGVRIESTATLAS